MNSPLPQAAFGTNMLSSEQLRTEFLVTDLFTVGEVRMRHWEVDRAVLGGIVPTSSALELPVPQEMRAASFFERREAGVINLGGPGRVTAGATQFDAGPLDGLYLGRGTPGPVTFASADPANPARFWLLSYPAHAAHPNRLVRREDVPGDRLGASASANARTIYKYFHPGAFPTCQLVMGVTKLEPGSVWNTMPPHTHLRRSEIYCYFDVPDNQAVFHFMGLPQETRHLVVRNCEAVLSPPWSIHCGVGTTAYSFIWAMGGENQEFTDMDPAPVNSLI
ncbi:MAG: 5-dehydro-4-deoxy-D-glucuronate isomerase [Opitutaceae bacterium]|nr:5-dehydro-4-deoxy-D-glucuronate isomerase [Opitutaceae bacterium]